MLCSFAFNLVNGFQDIRQFAICKLKLEQKLKVIGFMKKFGGRPFGISVGGFFYVKKNFLIRLWLTYTSSQICFVLLSFAFGSILLGKRFVEVSKELENTNRATKAFLQNLMEKILKLWEFFQEVNENWSILFPVMYIHFVYESCFFLFGSLFAKINVILRISVFVTALILLIGSLLVSWALSKFTSIVYDNFISIGKFYSEPLSLEYKFKVIGFMKKFGGRPFGISVGGFFYVKKNFPIRVMSGLYSVFSTLIQLTGVLRRKSCTSRINENVVITNTTVH
ncbi:uncharacterized protein LOC111639495 [Centruroides sculpturatus]|uniref:uncharacterized protein LOC111639495 n=1 Tax=Centruroides sculpturatus TaxID=218467 RepID=UPI000C6D2658|nr:uncharacterized protein LOC111639495 [Centruroides sculpturatus]